MVLFLPGFVGDQLLDLGGSMGWFLKEPRGALGTARAGGAFLRARRC